MGLSNSKETKTMSKKKTKPLLKKAMLKKEKKTMPKKAMLKKEKKTMPKEKKQKGGFDNDFFNY